MPYSVKNPPKDLKKKIKKRHPKATINEIRQFIHVFNNSISEGESEARAFAKAWGVLNQNKKLKSSHQKTNKKETIKEVNKWERKQKRKKKKKGDKKKKTKKKSSYDLERARLLMALANQLDDLHLSKVAERIEDIAGELIDEYPEETAS